MMMICARKVAHDFRERSHTIIENLGPDTSERFVHATTRRRDRVDGDVNGTKRTVEGIFVVKSTRRLALEGWGARFRSAILLFDAGSGNLHREKRPVDLRRARKAFCRARRDGVCSRVRAERRCERGRAVDFRSPVDAAVAMRATARREVCLVRRETSPAEIYREKKTS